MFPLSKLSCRKKKKKNKNAICREIFRRQQVHRRWASPPFCRLHKTSIPNCLDYTLHWIRMAHLAPIPWFSILDKSETFKVTRGGCFIASSVSLNLQDGHGLRVFHSEVLGWGLVIWISNQFPNDENVADWGTTSICFCKTSFI